MNDFNKKCEEFDIRINIPKAKKEVGENPTFKIGNRTYVYADGEYEDNPSGGDNDHPFFQTSSGVWHVALLEVNHRFWASISCDMIFNSWVNPTPLSEATVTEILSKLKPQKYYITIGLVKHEKLSIQETVTDLIIRLLPEHYDIKTFNIHSTQLGAQLYCTGTKEDIERISNRLEDIKSFDDQMFVQDYTPISQ